MKKPTSNLLKEFLNEQVLVDKRVECLSKIRSFLEVILHRYEDYFYNPIMAQYMSLNEDDMDEEDFNITQCNIVQAQDDVESKAQELRDLLSEYRSTFQDCLEDLIAYKDNANEERKTKLITAYNEALDDIDFIETCIDSYEGQLEEVIDKINEQLYED